jgi:hypothetical protein
MDGALENALRDTAFCGAGDDATLAGSRLIAR